MAAGAAFTVRARAGDNLMLHRAADLAEPGDLVCCDEDGVVVVPLDEAHQATEQAAERDIEAGRWDRDCGTGTVGPGLGGPLLRQRGCEGA